MLAKQEGKSYWTWEGFSRDFNLPAGIGWGFEKDKDVYDVAELLRRFGHAFLAKQLIEDAETSDLDIEL